MKTKQVTYKYDAFDRRIAKDVDDDGDGTFDRGERYVYDGSDIVLVFTDAGALTERLLYGPAVDQPLASEDGSGNVRWMLADNQGTIRDVAVYDAGQDDTNVVNHLAYDSFGNIASQSNPSQAPRGTFTGQQWDADAGMYYYGGRWYDGDTGQFVSAAPPPGSGAPANMGNPYAYAANSPTNLVVPTGAMPVPPPVGDMQVPSAAEMMQRGLMGMSPPSPQPTAGTSPGLGPRGLTAGGRRGMVDVMNDIDSGLGASTEAWRQEHIVYDQQVLADFQTRLPGWSVVVSAANLWNGHDMLGRQLSTTDKIFDGLNVVGALAGMGGATSAVDDVADAARTSRAMQHAGMPALEAVGDSDALRKMMRDLSRPSADEARNWLYRDGNEFLKELMAQRNLGPMGFPDIRIETVWRTNASYIPKYKGMVVRLDTYAAMRRAMQHEMVHFVQHQTRKWWLEYSVKTWAPGSSLVRYFFELDPYRTVPSVSGTPWSGALASTIHHWGSVTTDAIYAAGLTWLGYEVFDDD